MIKKKSKIPNKLTFDLESNPEMRLYVLYAGLRMYMESKRETDKKTPDMFSLAGAEAYCLLQDLKEKLPELYAQCEEEYNDSHNGIAASERTDVLPQIDGKCQLPFEQFGMI